MDGAKKGKKDAQKKVGSKPGLRGSTVSYVQGLPSSLIQKAKLVFSAELLTHVALPQQVTGTLSFAAWLA